MSDNPKRLIGKESVMTEGSSLDGKFNSASTSYFIHLSPCMSILILI